MRLLFLQSGFGAGGAEKVVAQVASHRADLGDSVHVAGMNIPQGGSYYSFSENVQLHALEVQNPQSTKTSQLARLKYIRQLRRELNPDIVISFLTKINTLTLLAGVFNSTPIIVSERNNPEKQAASPIWRYALPLLAGRADSIVLLTQAAQNRLPGRLRRKAVVIPNPCALEDGVKPRPIGVCREIVAVGRLVPQKGFDLLLPVFDKIRQVHPETRLTIYGDGHERPALEQQVARLGLHDFVSMPGVTNSPGEWLKKADLLLVTSRYEGFCNVLAEATVAGIPCVSFDCDFGPSFLVKSGVNGILVPPEDTEAMTQAALQLIADPTARRAMRNSASINREKLAPQTVLAQWDDVIEATVSFRRAGRIRS